MAGRTKVEASVDAEESATAVEPAPDVETSPAPADDEAPVVADEVKAEETPREKLARLLAEGVPHYQLKTTTNRDGVLVKVELAPAG